MEPKLRENLSRYFITIQFLVVLIATLLLSSCSSTPKRNIASNEPPKMEIPEEFQFRMSLDQFSCNLARSISPSDDINEVDPQRIKIRKKLSELADQLPDIVDSIEGQSNLQRKFNSLLYSNEDIWAPYAFVLQAKDFKGSNFTSALNGVIADQKLKNPEYSAINDTNLLEKVRAEKKRIDESERLMRPEDKNNATEFEVIDRVDKISSPLVEWLLTQPKHSVGPIEFYKKALDIYSDPWVAIGVVAVIAQTTTEPRKLNAVTSSKLKPIFPQKPQDHSGTLYHFWGYLIRVLLNPTDSARLRTLSYGYEMVVQKDPQDFYADHWGINVGQSIQNQWTPSAPNRPCDKFDRPDNNLLIPHSSN